MTRKTTRVPPKVPPVEGGCFYAVGLAIGQVFTGSGLCGKNQVALSVLKSHSTVRRHVRQWPSWPLRHRYCTDGLSVFITAPAIRLWLGAIPQR